MKWYRFDTILTSILFSFFFGIFITSIYYNLEHLLVLLMIVFLLCFTSILLGRFVFKFNLRSKFIVINAITLCIVVFISIGVIRFHIDMVSNSSQVVKHVGETITTSGFVVSQAEDKKYSSRFIIKTDDEKILINSKDKIFPKYGSFVSVHGMIKTPKSFLTNTDRIFDYKKYLAKDNVFVIIDADEIKSDVDKKPCCFVSRKLLYIKDFFVSKINFLLPKPHGDLLNGILLGEKNTLSTELRDDFIKTGTIHIIALSGYNVSIVAEAIIKILSNFLSRNIAHTFGGLGIIVFVIMTGGQITAIRAGAMASVLLLTKSVGSSYTALRALWYVSFVMVMINPKILLWDISFQLSFLATASIILFFPLWEKWLDFIKFKFLRQVLTSTLSAQVLVTPWIAYSIGNISFISPLANLLILPFIPFVMGFGFIMSIFSMFPINYITSIFSYITFYLLDIILNINNKLAHTFFSSSIVPEFSIVILIGIYAIIFYIFFIFYKKR